MKEERYEAILDIIEKKEFVSVKTLSEMMYVSMPTIRRDLTRMQEMGLIKRGHGGAISKDANRVGAPAPFRACVKPDEKMRMCREAAKLLHDNCVIFLDESTTTVSITEFLSDFKNITIVTNSMEVLNRAYEKNIDACCLGGKLSYETKSFLGSCTEEMVSHYGIDYMFFSSSGINRNGWIVDYYPAANSLRRSVAQFAENKVFLCDSSKFLKNEVYTLMPLSEADYIITDEALPEGLDSGKAVTIVI
ncbi:MAG: DeoR/GlpR family DNA-binding transcription regulator [Eubacteriales bacterium]|nr:DeoR/GlpR family DNA-binding transcription regulator [Eubacteriales bacterium]